MLAQMENNRHCREVRRRDRTDERRSAFCSDTPTKNTGWEWVKVCYQKTDLHISLSTDLDLGVFFCVCPLAIHSREHRGLHRAG